MPDAKRDDEILRKLDAMVRLSALQMTKDMKTVEKIRLLARAGLDRRMIAELAGTTPDAVSVRISEFKRESKAPATRKSPATSPVADETND